MLRGHHMLVQENLSLPTDFSALKQFVLRQSITIYLGLVNVKNTDLQIKLRRNTKPSRVKKLKKNLGTSISDYSYNDIIFIEDWMNTLPRRILKYKIPEKLFMLCLD